jgi:hypothetical protein
LIFEDGPGTQIVINTDALDRSLTYVKGKNLVEQHCAKRKNGQASRLVLMTTQSASRGGETYVVVGDKIGCNQPSIYSSTLVACCLAVPKLGASLNPEKEKSCAYLQVASR